MTQVIESFRRKLMDLAARSKREPEVAMVILKGYLDENPAIADALLALYEECLELAFCGGCLQQDLKRMNPVDNKRFCPECGRIHTRTDVSGYFRPTNRRVTLPFEYKPQRYIRLGLC